MKKQPRTINVQTGAQLGRPPQACPIAPPQRWRLFSSLRLLTGGGTLTDTFIHMLGRASQLCTYSPCIFMELRAELMHLAPAGACRTVNVACVWVRMCSGMQVFQAWSPNLRLSRDHPSSLNTPTAQLWPTSGCFFFLRIAVLAVSSVWSVAIAAADRHISINRLQKKRVLTNTTNPLGRTR